jgi:single-strand DNA-binding protein
MNGVTAGFTGRLGRDPESKYTAQGKQMLQLNIAVDQDQRQTDGRPEAETTWVRVVCWEEKAAELEGRLSKGSLVYVEGRLKFEKWQAASGEQKSGLSLSAWVVQPLGAFRRPGNDDRQPVGAGASRQDELGELPF